MSRRQTTPEERQLFEKAAGGSKSAPAAVESRKTAEQAAKKTRQPRMALALQGPSGLDGGTAERLRKGTIDPDAKLDLHGLTEQAAHRELLAFLRNAASRGARLLLIVTGKGSKLHGPEEPFDLEFNRRARGVLNAMVPRWLEEPEIVRFVADVRTAHRRHGGTGALYVYLRKFRRRA